jgi:hypothetical protein
VFGTSSAFLFKDPEKDSSDEKDDGVDFDFIANEIMEHDEKGRKEILEA